MRVNPQKAVLVLLAFGSLVACGKGASELREWRPDDHQPPPAVLPEGQGEAQESGDPGSRGTIQPLAEGEGGPPERAARDETRDGAPDPDASGQDARTQDSDPRIPAEYQEYFTKLAAYIRQFLGRTGLREVESAMYDVARSAAMGGKELIGIPPRDIALVIILWGVTEARDRASGPRKARLHGILASLMNDREALIQERKRALGRALHASGQFG